MLSVPHAELAKAIGGEKGMDRHTPWLPSTERDAKDPELAAVLRKVTVWPSILGWDTRTKHGGGEGAGNRGL